MALAMLACGGSTASPASVDGGVRDGQASQDAPSADSGLDASYLACFS